MEFNKNEPIYSQIMDMFKIKIASGQLKPGEKIQAVRDIALETGVNPNTMQKALSLLEVENLVYSERTSGRYVTEDTEVIRNLRLTLLRSETARFAEVAKALGCTKEEATKLLGEFF